jgi:hypothetical protein
MKNLIHNTALEEEKLNPRIQHMKNGHRYGSSEQWGQLATYLKHRHY